MAEIDSKSLAMVTLCALITVLCSACEAISARTIRDLLRVCLYRV